EKISYLPRKLSVAGAPSGYTPSVGDITYYAPWGNLAIFYKESKAGFANGLINLGKIDGGLEGLLGSDGLNLTIEKIE
ncbi:MAG: cyclophilin-like fold protein, partial [Methylotenera sp.]